MNDKKLDFKNWHLLSLIGLLNIAIVAFLDWKLKYKILSILIFTPLLSYGLSELIMKVLI